MESFEAFTRSASQKTGKLICPEKPFLGQQNHGQNGFQWAKGSKNKGKNGQTKTQHKNWWLITHGLVVNDQNVLRVTNDRVSSPIWTTLSTRLCEATRCRAYVSFVPKCCLLWSKIINESKIYYRIIIVEGSHLGIHCFLRLSVSLKNVHSAILLNWQHSGTQQEVHSPEPRKLLGKLGAGSATPDVWTKLVVSKTYTKTGGPSIPGLGQNLNICTKLPTSQNLAI